MKYCNRCREKFLEHFNFCPHCGRALKRTPGGEAEEKETYEED